MMMSPQSAQLQLPIPGEDNKRSDEEECLWTELCPKFASKIMGTYVSRDFFLTNEFACTYVCRNNICS